MPNSYPERSKEKMTKEVGEGLRETSGLTMRPSMLTRNSTHLAMIAAQTVALTVADHEPILAIGKAKPPDEVVVVSVGPALRWSSK